MATFPQLMALYKDTGKILELRELGDKLSVERAKTMISRMRDQGVSPNVIVEELLALGAFFKDASDTTPKSAPKGKAADPFKALYDEAHKAGDEAAKAMQPQPMLVAQHANMLDDNSPIVKAYHVSEGSCGFAWVWFKGNTAWGRWCLKNKRAEKSYEGGLRIWVSNYGQSIERKFAYAAAFCGVLQKHGITAYPQSRDD